MPKKRDTESGKTPVSRPKTATARSRKTASTAGALEGTSRSVRALANAVAKDSFVQTREEIERLAYRYWEQRGFQNGSDMDDWLRAEQEVLACQGCNR
ncbi:MAG: DUF2934 domain-containing protein [Acidobacteria bacterium]|nr:DUF2934 domain-containing protein [Acidobacteriota bacterium]